jgi:hypothetical protein
MAKVHPLFFFFLLSLLALGSGCRGGGEGRGGESEMTR